jgi:hypothetical protein
MTAEPAGGESDPAYAYRASVLGAPFEFQLTGGAIVWNAGRRSGRVPYRRVRRVRMSYRPASMQSHRFLTEIWAEDFPKFKILSCSWKSMVELERLDGPYTAFVGELHRRLVEAGAPVRYEQGATPFAYWPGLVIFVAVSLGFAGLIVRSLQAGALGAVAVVAAFLALFLWQGGSFFRRNRPGLYRPDSLPPELMAKG